MESSLLGNTTGDISAYQATGQALLSLSKLRMSRNRQLRVRRIIEKDNEVHFGAGHLIFNAKGGKIPVMKKQVLRDRHRGARQPERR